jgi:hypothetical protein
MCNLYSLTRSQEAIRRAFRVMRDLSVWIIPAAEPRTAKRIPFRYLSLLRSFCVACRGSGSLFSAPARRSMDFQKPKPPLDASSGVTDWRLHDLRRTLATGLQRLGVRLEVTEAMLNHVSGSRAGIVGVYQRHNWAEEKRARPRSLGQSRHGCCRRARARRQCGCAPGVRPSEARPKLLVIY